MDGKEIIARYPVTSVSTAPTAPCLMYAEFIARPLVLGLTHAIFAKMATVAQIVNIYARSATTRINALLPIHVDHTARLDLASPQTCA